MWVLEGEGWGGYKSDNSNATLYSCFQNFGLSWIGQKIALLVAIASSSYQVEDYPLFVTWQILEGRHIFLTFLSPSIKNNSCHKNKVYGNGKSCFTVFTRDFESQICSDLKKRKTM